MKGGCLINTGPCLKRGRDVLDLSLSGRNAWGATPSGSESPGPAGRVHFEEAPEHTLLFQPGELNGTHAWLPEDATLSEQALIP